MEEKTAKELVKQLTRIANALEKSNVIEEVREKRRIKLEKLEEKNLRAILRDDKEDSQSYPRIGSEG
jgi:hypothetical protein